MEAYLLKLIMLVSISAYFELPNDYMFRDRTTYTDLAFEEAKKVIEKYNEEACKELGLEWPIRRQGNFYNQRGNGRFPNRGGYEWRGENNLVLTLMNLLGIWTCLIWSRY